MPATELRLDRLTLQLKLSQGDEDLMEACSRMFYARLQPLMAAVLERAGLAGREVVVNEPLVLNLGALPRADFESHFCRRLEPVLLERLLALGRRAMRPQDPLAQATAQPEDNNMAPPELPPITAPQAAHGAQPDPHDEPAPKTGPADPLQRSSAAGDPWAPDASQNVTLPAGHAEAATWTSAAREQPVDGRLGAAAAPGYRALQDQAWPAGKEPGAAHPLPGSEPRWGLGSDRAEEGHPEALSGRPAEQEPDARAALRAGAREVAATSGAPSGRQQTLMDAADASRTRPSPESAPTTAYRHASTLAVDAPGLARASPGSAAAPGADPAQFAARSDGATSVGEGNTSPAAPSRSADVGGAPDPHANVQPTAAAPWRVADAPTPAVASLARSALPAMPAQPGRMRSPPRAGGVRAPLSGLPEVVPVSNAGACLLWPLLPALWRQLGLLGEKDFVDTAARHAATVWLDEVVWGDGKHHPPRWRFNQMLCGLPLDEHVVPLPLEDDHRAQLARFVSALPTCAPMWAKLGIVDIRALFLQRPGWVVIRGEDWSVHVEPQPYDLLLEGCPWPTDILMLPWLTQPWPVRWALPPDMAPAGRTETRRPT